MSFKYRRSSKFSWKISLIALGAAFIGFYCGTLNFIQKPKVNVSKIIQKINPTTNFYSECKFENILKYYDFESPEKQNALKELMIMASLMSQNDSWEKIFPSDQKIHNIINFVTNTQWKFSNRFGHERWEIEAQSWIDLNRDQILANLKVLGFIDEIAPKFNKYDAVCLLGANTLCMSVRTKYLSKLIQEKALETSTVILLTGERYANSTIDGTPEELQQIASKFQINDWKQLTEAKIFEYIYEQSPLSNMPLNLVIINTPKGELPRPTTKTTLAELKKWLKEHRNIKKILFISNQPYVLYQNAVVRNELNPEKQQEIGEIEIEMVGPTVPDIFLERTSLIVEGLGSYIWAKAPSVIEKISSLNHKIADS